jgi:hypothetical protein
MKASDFEVRHQRLLHQLLVLAAFLTYLVDRDDIVWLFIKNSGGHVRGRERAVFAIATMLFAVAAYLCTRARIHGRSRAGYRGEFLYAIALGSLAPLAGFVILTAGEAIRLSRLAARGGGFAEKEAIPWTEALRAQAVQWGLLLTMIAFTITLEDRVAEILAGLSVLVWITLNLPRAHKQRA